MEENSNSRGNSLVSPTSPTPELISFVSPTNPTPELIPPSVVMRSFRSSYPDLSAIIESRRQKFADSQKCSNEGCQSQVELMKQDCGHLLCEGCFLDKEMSQSECPKCEKNINLLSSATSAALVLDNKVVRSIRSQYCCELCGAKQSAKDPLRKCKVDGEIFCGLCAWVHLDEKAENGDSGEHKLFSLRDVAAKEQVYSETEEKFQVLFQTFAKTGQEIDFFNKKLTKTEADGKNELDKLCTEIDNLSREKFEEEVKNLESAANRVLKDMKFQLNRITEAISEDIDKLREAFLPGLQDKEQVSSEQAVGSVNCSKALVNTDSNSNSSLGYSTGAESSKGNSSLVVNVPWSDVEQSGIDSTPTPRLAKGFQDRNASKPEKFETTASPTTTPSRSAVAGPAGLIVEEDNAVIYVVGLNMGYFNCDYLFNLLCQYGDVIAVKFTFKHDGCALVQMRNQSQMEDAIKNLNGIHLFGLVLKLMQSSVSYLKLKERGYMTYTLPTGQCSVKDYSADTRHRFCSSQKREKNLKLPPNNALHFWNMASGSTEGDVRYAFHTAGARNPVRVSVFPNDRGANSTVGIVTFRTVGEAVEAVVLANHIPYHGRKMYLSFAKPKAEPQGQK